MYEQLFQNQEDIFKVIANQKRLEIIQLLTHGELPVHKMVEMLGISQSNVSQHLGLLRHAGILTTRKDGKTIYYSLKDKRIADACSLIRQFLVSENVVNNSDILDQEVDILYPLRRDPVCGMRMGLAEVSAQHSFNGSVYYFCASGCKDTFIQNPSHYATLVNSYGGIND